MMKNRIYHIAKRIITTLLTFSLLGALGCGSVNQSAKYAQSQTSSNKTEETASTKTDVDEDLTTMSSTMIYSEVYNMVNTPKQYVGKRIRITGQFTVVAADSSAPVDNYYYIIIKDATACCQQGMEFILAKGTYPNDYPTPDTDATVVGTFETYDENGSTYCHLANAVVE